MTIREIKSKIVSRLSQAASDYWHNSTEKSDFITIAEREGIDAAVAAIEEAADAKIPQTVLDHLCEMGFTPNDEANDPIRGQCDTFDRGPIRVYRDDTDWVIVVFKSAKCQTIKWEVRFGGGTPVSFIAAALQSAVDSYAKQLMKELANAAKTCYGALGHKKAHANWQIIERLKVEIRSLGYTIPSTDDLLSVGVFNGPGSY